MSPTTKGLLCGLGAASIWGAMYVVSKVVLDIIPPFALITTRLALGGLSLYLLLRRRGPARLGRRDFSRVFAVGSIGYGVSLGLQFIGTKMSTAANGALVTSATPAFVLLLAYLLLHEPIGGTRPAALLISTVGVVAVVDPRNAELDTSLFWGNLARRVQLGLCDPVVANRFLLWGVYGGATLLCALAYLTSIGVATHAGEYPFFLDVLMIVPTVFAALALWLAFFPSRAYRSWLTAGTGDASL